jgi:hypothetical protein
VVAAEGLAESDFCTIATPDNSHGPKVLSDCLTGASDDTGSDSEQRSIFCNLLAVFPSRLHPARRKVSHATLPCSLPAVFFVYRFLSPGLAASSG